MTIIEVTSGNTGIGLALVGGMKGYDVLCIMPENMSDERKKIIKAFGGDLLLTPAEESFPACFRELEKRLEEDPARYFHANQFSNTCNPDIHYMTTAKEIWADLNGEIDIFVAGVGSGGTLQGIGRYLKEMNPNIKVVAVEPQKSAALLGREPGLHGIQGIGDGFVPEVLDVNLVDMVFTVSDQEAIETTRLLSQKEGLLAGISAGANVFVARHLDNGRNRIVTILPDRAERYFSTALL